MSWYYSKTNTPQRSSTSVPASEALTELRLLPPTTNEETTQPRNPGVRPYRIPISREDHVPLSNGTMIPPKIVQYRLQIFLALASFLLSAFAFYYAYEALINPRPLLGKPIFSPSTTVFVINVLSQSVAFLIARVFASVFEALRWSFAARNSGVMLPTFLSLSSGTSLYGILRLLLARGYHRIWCVQRLLYPVLCSFVGVILTYNINFQQVYTPGTTIPVFAGLTPLNTSFAQLVPSSVEAIYFVQWAYTILATSKFVTGISSPTCNGVDCTPVFLPGGLETVRLRTTNLNVTLLNGTVLEGASTVLISDAPGFQLEFFPIDPNYLFDPHNCTIYGEGRGDGLQFCLASDNYTILAGWSICPSPQFTTGTCYSDLSWSYILQQATAMNVYKRYSTVAYDRRNLSILSVESISEPEQIKLDPTDYRTVFDSIFTPQQNATSVNTEMTNSLIFQTGWFLRLVQDEFRDDAFSPLNFLRGMLTVPIQFTVTAWQFVNATIEATFPGTTNYALPADLEVSASAAKGTYRALSNQRWTVYVFIGTAELMLIICDALVGLLYTQRTIAPNLSAFSEIDACSKSSYPPTHLVRPVRDYCSILRDVGLGNAQTGKIVRSLQGKRIRVAGMDGVQHDDSFLFLAVTDTNRLDEIEDLPSLLPRVPY